MTEDSPKAKAPARGRKASATAPASEPETVGETPSEAPAAPEAAEPTFAGFGLSPAILEGIEAAGFTQPSPVQVAAIPLVLAGRDLVAQAQTGTGKTAAFGLPLMSMLEPKGGADVLVIVPTRELAGQISDELFRLGRAAGVQTVAIYGGQSYDRQLERLARARVVVATPGRLIDLLESGRMPGFAPRAVVLDEADEMLDMGFLEAIEQIFTFLPPERQTLLFSATMPTPIRRLAERILQDPAWVRMGDGQRAAEGIRQQYHVIEEHERDDAILRLVDSMEPSRGIVFCRTRIEVDRVAAMLEAQGIGARGLHGEMDQRQRTQVINAFRGGRVRLLVATDVAARGLDVSDVSHVFNYHIPFDAESYVHRIGRTGRAGREGVAVTLVTPREMRTIQRIAQSVGELAPREMPTAAYVRRQTVSRLQTALSAQAVDPAVSPLLEALEAEMPLAEVAARALSMLLGDDEVRGPELIGLSHKEIRRLADRAASAPDRPRRPFRPGGKPGGRRFDGGGPGGAPRARKGPGKGAWKASGGKGNKGGKPFGKGPGGKGGKRGD